MVIQVHASFIADKKVEDTINILEKYDFLLLDYTKNENEEEALLMHKTFPFILKLSKIKICIHYKSQHKVKTEIVMNADIYDQYSYKVLLSIIHALCKETELDEIQLW